MLQIVKALNNDCYAEHGCLFKAHLKHKCHVVS